MTIPIRISPKARYRGLATLDGAAYILTIKWHPSTEKWYMDLKGLSNDVDLKGKVLLCGKDLLRPHGYSELGELWLIDNAGVNEDPNYADFGSRWTLEYTPRPVVTPRAARVYALTDVEIWVEVNPYDATSIAAVLAYGAATTMGTDVDYSTFDDYIEAAYGSSVSSSIGLVDAWGAQSSDDIEIDRHEIAAFAAVRIQASGA